MKRSTLTLATALMLALGFGSATFANAEATPKPFVAISDPSVTTTLQKGAYFVVGLPSNAGTGYDWDLVSVEPAGAATPTGKSSMNPNAHPASPGSPQIVGGEVTTLLLFRAGTPGAATLTFALRRSWEKDAKPARTAVFHIIVK